MPFHCKQFSIFRVEKIRLVPVILPIERNEQCIIRSFVKKSGAFVSIFILKFNKFKTKPTQLYLT